MSYVKVWTVCLGLALFVVPAGAADVTLKINAGQPSHAISPRLIGIFLEDINFAVDGGLNAELIKNGSFEFPHGLTGWSLSKLGKRPPAEVSVHQRTTASANSHFLQITPDSLNTSTGIVNEGFRGIGVRAGDRYLFSANFRTAEDTSAGKIRVMLIDEDGEGMATADLPAIASEWSHRSATLIPTRTTTKARLALSFSGPTTVDVDLVSLCPEKTWKNRQHGMRADLVQLLANLRPAFFRFPGGCIVEGSRLADRYQWKQTIGDQSERQLNFNRWNTAFQNRQAPDYYQSNGVGLFEYFQMAEDIGAEPLPILNCGMACQFQSGELVPLDQLRPYVQDALDLIEFANGPETSEWGAKRAALGHPKPFGLKLIGVGNEQWGPEYIERYQVFAQALKEHYPKIKLVSAAGPFPSDPHFHYAWPRLRDLKADIVDEHCYAMPDWFLRAATRFDDYDRNGPKVFMGEYAAQSVDISSPHNRNNLRCALAEAAFLTGIERNSDVVAMSAYAPLLGHVDAWQWRPNLIWFDNLNVLATPNYYVQQLFSHHRGDIVVPIEVADSRPPASPSGRIGLATDKASAEFKDICVEHDGLELFSGAELSNSDISTFRGRWNVRGGVIRQENSGDAARALFGNFAWGDCTVSLKARKLAVAGGFAVIFRNSDGGSFLQWTLGGRDNQHRLEANVALHSEDQHVVQHVHGQIDPERWYTLQVELRGESIRCHLDGKLVLEASVPGPNLPQLYATASRDEESQQLIVKVVNPTSEPAEADVLLEGVDAIASTAELIVLSGDPEDENSLTEPNRVVPKSQPLEIQGGNFQHTFPPHSLSVLRIAAD